MPVPPPATPDPPPLLPPLETIEAVVEQWNGDESFSSQTVTRMGEHALRFARRLETLGITDLHDVGHVEATRFVDAPTRHGLTASIGTRHFRRVTLRALYRTLRSAGHALGDPTLDIVLPPRGTFPARPLTDDELVLCRSAAFSPHTNNLRRPVAWALAEATAITSELAHVTRGDLDHPTRPTAVALPGTAKAGARTVALTDWGAKVIARHLEALPRGRHVRLVYDGHQGRRAVAPQASACRHLTSVLLHAGLGSEADLRPVSVRHWRARNHYERTGNLPATARLLGLRSLDATATAIALDWQQEDPQ